MTAVQLGAGAVIDYRENGWRITAHGHVDAGIVIGPCGRCRAPCLRYGPAGRALCAICQPTVPTFQGQKEEA